MKTFTENITGIAGVIPTHTHTCRHPNLLHVLALHGSNVVFGVNLCNKPVGRKLPFYHCKKKNVKNQVHSMFMSQIQGVNKGVAGQYFN